MLKSRLLLVAPVIAVIVSRSAAENPKPEQVDWLKKNLIPLTTCEAGNGFDDLAPLKALIGDAKIVSLGECTHGTREVFQMKHRLVEFLATQMGFTIFSIEASMPEAYRLNDYVLEGKGDPRQLIAGMYFWTWNTEEVLAMVEWMREFNKSGKGRIEFTGFDMQTPDVAADIVLDHLEKADPARHKDVEDTYKKCENAPFRQGGGGGGEFGVCTGTFPLELVKGKKIRYSGWIKTAGVTEFAGLWWRVDGKSGVLAFDNMHDRGINGDTVWKEHAIELEVPDQATNINFGVIMPGQGKAWFDGLKVEVDGKVLDLAESFDLDFESDALLGFGTGGQGYAVTLDKQVAKAGGKSLRLEYTGGAKPAATDGGITADEAARLCGDIVTSMEAARNEYAKKTSPKEADWAIQNARVVHQCFQMHANQVQRDESMARNVKWIVDHAPKDAKLVLWAHNGHVHRMMKGGFVAMGANLDEYYGKQYLPIGFSTAEGEYTAIAQGKGLRHDNKLRPPAGSSYERFFRASGVPIFALDLRQARMGDVGSGWLARPRSFRSIGALAMHAQFSTHDLPKLFDAVIHIDKTTASRPIEKLNQSQ